MARSAQQSALAKLANTEYRGTPMGSINALGNCLSDEQALWLLESAEKSKISVAEWISALVKDAYFEDRAECREC